MASLVMCGRKVWWCWVVVVLMVEVARCSRAEDTCQQCDCKLSPNEEDDRAVYSLRVQSRCQAGSLAWSSAYSGAVRLHLQPSPGPSPHTPYRLCFVISGHHTLAQVSLEDWPSQKDTPRQDATHYQNQRVHQNHHLHTSSSFSSEVRRRHAPHSRGPSMRRLVSTGAGEGQGQSEEVCVDGASRQDLVLFLEVQRNNEFSGVPSVLLQYDVERRPSSSGSVGNLLLHVNADDAAAAGGGINDLPPLLDDPMEECRPCTQEELLDAYCTSDFVAVGTIQQTRSGEGGSVGVGEEVSHLEVAARQLIHQNVPVFSRQHRDHPHLLGTITAPAKCGIRATPTTTTGKGGRGGRGGGGGGRVGGGASTKSGGPAAEGNYLLFTGRMRLGKAKLRCAPYLQDWLRISHLAECVYD